MICQNCNRWHGGDVSCDQARAEAELAELRDDLERVRRALARKQAALKPFAEAWNSDGAAYPARIQLLPIEAWQAARREYALGEGEE